MEDDLQPRIAVLGAGPIGLEAALYARYLGYPVEILERAAHPVASVLALGDEPLAVPFVACASTLGVAALQAQDPNWKRPAAKDCLTALEWCQRYLMPLAESDLISEVLRLDTSVIDIARGHDDTDFRVRCRNSQGAELNHMADIVIDSTGIDDIRDWFKGDSNVELSFLNPDADCYVLGSKSRSVGTFTFQEGLTQIRDLFAILGERDDLNIYATMPAIE
jgi:threonine dehydrogenase-like Zn-dependent dehydrogenase